MRHPVVYTHISLLCYTFRLGHSVGCQQISHTGSNQVSYFLIAFVTNVMMLTQSTHITSPFTIFIELIDTSLCYMIIFYFIQCLVSDFHNWYQITGYFKKYYHMCNIGINTCLRTFTFTFNCIVKYGKNRLNAICLVFHQ